MEIDDPALPAVPHLTGATAADVVGAAVTIAGGTLHDLRASQVQYRPGTDLVVRYEADVTWADGRRRPGETLLAAAHPGGALPGTIAVVADEDRLVASVWRWPFDPVVVGLEDAVTSGSTDDLVADVVGARPEVEVVAYRPTERAVIRLTGAGGHVTYLKAVPPAELPALGDRHRRLLDAGLPVPEVLATDADRGLVVLRAMEGTTLRERVKGALPGWPSPAHVGDLISRIHRADPAGLPGRPGRVADAIGHAHLVATIVPEAVPDLERLTARFTSEAPAVDARRGALVHGDLHEGQLVVDACGRVTGLLDVDDVAVGDPVDDFATLIGHLWFRSRSLDPADAGRPRLERHVRALHDHAAAVVGRTEIDVAVAAVLVGLATGPFRVQRPGWREDVLGVVADATRLIEPRRQMRGFSGPAHGHLTGDHEGGDQPRTPLTKGSA